LKKVFRNVYSRKRTRIAAVIIAGLIGLIALGGDLKWTALADPGDTEGIKTEIPQPTVDMDSLYAAKTAESEANDTSYTLLLQPARTFEGHVSWYGARFNGRRTANGERFDMNRMTAAHKTLPFNTLVRVVDKRSGRAVLVRVNDRGPYVGGRILDLSKKAAGRLGMRSVGTTNASIEVFPETTIPVDSDGTTGDDRSEEAGSLTYVTFDSDLRGASPNGWSVQLATFDVFDEAADLHHDLLGDFRDVYLTRVIRDGEIVYSVSVGLANSEVLGRNILVDIGSEFDKATLVRFRNGFPVGVDADEPVADRT